MRRVLATGAEVDSAPFLQFFLRAEAATSRFHVNVGMNTEWRFTVTSQVVGPDCVAPGASSRQRVLRGAGGRDKDAPMLPPVYYVSGLEKPPDEPQAPPDSCKEIEGSQVKDVP